jgi:lipopolysaccharide export system permease protein
MNIRLIKKLDLYILKKFLGTFFFLILIIVVIAIVFDISEKIDDFVEHNASAHAIIFEYYMNFAPYFALLFSPMFTFIAVIFFTSKMAYQTEIIAILSSGTSFLRLLYPYFLGALILAILTFSLNNFVLPSANKTRLKFEDRYLVGPSKPSSTPSTIEERNIHKQIQPGVFIYLESYSSLSNVGYKFTIEKFEEGKLKEKLTSDYITWDSIAKKWAVTNYHIRKIAGLQEIMTGGAKIDTSIGLTPEDFVRRDNAVETMNFFELNHFIKQQKLHGEESINTYLLEKNKRIAGPFSTFILTLIGVALSSRKVRGGIGMHIGLGLGICFAFILFNQFSSQFAISGSLSPALAVWIPNIIFFGIGIVLYRLAPK